MLKCANSWYFSLKMIVKINKSIKLFKQILYESNQIKRTKQMKELNKFNQIKNFLFALFSHETQDLSNHFLSFFGVPILLASKIQFLTNYYKLFVDGTAN
jgi:hypothetical protein